MKVHIGCGKDPRKGYTTCDIRAMDGNIDIVQQSGIDFQPT